MAITVEFPHPILAPESSLSMTVTGATGQLTFSGYESAVLSFTQSPTSGNATQLTIQIIAGTRSVSAPQVYSYTVTDQSTPNNQTATFNVLVVPSGYSSGKNVFFYGSDGNVYLLSQLAGQSATLTQLTGQPTLVSYQRANATAPYALTRSISTAATAPESYVTCYLLDLTKLTNG
jgi:hypothetical protein